MENLDETDKKELAKAVELLQAFGAREIYLFGSMARGDMDRYSDWDFAVQGLPASEYFSAYAKLMQALSRPVDLVDLDEANPFSAYVRSKKEFTRVA
jgi:predicted nucleotidyltransferase